MKVKQYTISETKEKLTELISENETFIVYDLSGCISDAVELVEKEIEKQKGSCRVYTRNRAAGMLIPYLGIATAVGVAVHNLATYNPDFELGKDIARNRLHVDYKGS